jgi:cytochrome P450
MQNSTLPPGPREPSLVQLIYWIVRPIPFLEDCARRYGDAFTVRFLGQPPIVLFTHPDAVKDIFVADPEELYAGEANGFMEGLLGKNSLLLLDGTQHRRERKLMMPSFHGERLQAYGDVMANIASRAIASWPMNEPFAFEREMQEVTLDVMMHTVFGFEEGASFDRLRALLAGIVDHAASPFLLMLSLGVSPDRMKAMCARLATLPFDLGGSLPPVSLFRMLQETDALLSAEIARRRLAPSKGHDVLSTLIDARDDDGQPMTDIELRDTMFTLLFTGHETPAMSLAWVIFRLLTQPTVFADAKNEVARVVGAGPVRAEHVGQLSYLDATIKETMRLLPTIPIVVRKLKRPMTIQGRALPAGVVAAPCMYLTHRRDDIWDEPARFSPERFLTRRPTPYELFPFGGGVRRCVGMAFANFEMKIVLAEILRRATLAIPDGKEIKVVRRGVALSLSDGLPVMLTARN